MLSEQAPHLHGGMNQRCPLKLDRHTQGSLIFSILVLVVVLIEERWYFACLYEELPTAVGSLKPGYRMPMS